MPLIPQDWLACVVYIYRNRAAALAGEATGATGFVVTVPFEDDREPRGDHGYVVTCEHVVRQAGEELSIRLNLNGGGTDVIELPAKDWYRHPDGDDVALAPLDDKFANAPYRLTGMPIAMFLTPEKMTSWGIGVGSDCFFLGRHLHLSGANRNTPAAKFGTVSMIDAEPILQTGSRQGFRQESLVVEARSLAGYSGSPVFAYSESVTSLPTGPLQLRVPGVIPAEFPADQKPFVVSTPLMESPICLLGVYWGHMGAEGALLAPGLSWSAREKELAIHSGMAFVVPQWKAIEILNQPELKAMREETERSVREEENDNGVVLDGATSDSGTEFEKFENLTEKLLRVPKTGEKRGQE